MSEPRDFTNELRRYLVAEGLVRLPSQKTGDLPVCLVEQEDQLVPSAASLREKGIQTDTLVHIGASSPITTAVGEGWAVKKLVIEFAVRSDAKAGSALSPLKAKVLNEAIARRFTDETGYEIADTYVVYSNIFRGPTLVRGAGAKLEGFHYVATYRFTLRVESGAV